MNSDQRSAIRITPKIRKGLILSLIKALDLLESFSRAEPEVGLSELSRRLRLPKSTVSRLLSTLALRGYVRHDPKTEKYRLGMRAWEVGYLACSQYGLREAARPVIEQIHAGTQETVTLTILSHDGDAVILDRVQGTHSIHPYTHIGDRAPSYCTAHGKVLLAYQPPEVVSRLLKGRRVRAPQQALREVRAKGHAVNRGEWRAEVSDVAAPVRDHTGNVLAAVGVALPTFRMTEETTEHLVSLVVKAGEEISAALGYLGDS